MALVIVQTAAINQKGNLITLTDSTGADNILDSTKYATGNTNLNRGISNTISEVVITTPDKLVYTIVDNDAFSTANINVTANGTVFPKSSLTKTISPTDIGLASTVLFPDGIYKIEVYQHYLLVTSSDEKADYVNNSSLFFGGYVDTIKLGWVDTSLGKFIENTNPVAAAALSSYTQVSNNILSVVSEVISCDKPLFTDILNGYTCFATYKTTMYLKNTTNLLKCFQPKIAKISIAEKSCCSSCKDTPQKKLEDIFYGLFIVDAQFADGLYDEANSGILTLNKICNNEGCNC